MSNLALKRPLRINFVEKLKKLRFIFFIKAHVTHNIEIKRHFDKQIFFLQNIVVTCYNTFKLGFNKQIKKHNCQKKISIFTQGKILDEKCLFIFLLQYLFISTLCAKKSV